MFVFARFFLPDAFQLQKLRVGSSYLLRKFFALFGRKKTYFIRTGAYESELRSKRNFDFYGEK